MKRKKEKDTGISPWPWCIGIGKIAHSDANGKMKLCDMPCLMDKNHNVMFFLNTSTLPDASDIGRCESNAFLMVAAPELRNALLNLTRNICSDCRRQMKFMRKTDATPCEIDGGCPKGLGDAMHAIAKSYGKEN